MQYAENPNVARVVDQGKLQVSRLLHKYVYLSCMYMYIAYTHIIIDDLHTGSFCTL